MLGISKFVAFGVPDVALLGASTAALYPVIAMGAAPPEIASVNNRLETTPLVRLVNPTLAK